MAEISSGGILCDTWQSLGEAVCIFCRTEPTGDGDL